MTTDRIERAARECARRWYWTGSFDGGLSAETDRAEELNAGQCRDAIDHMARQLAALIRREREDAERQELERLNVTFAFAGVRVFSSPIVERGTVLMNTDDAAKLREQSQP